MKPIILLGNYPPDRQASMLRFQDLMSSALQEKGFPVERIQPRAFLGGSGWGGKWTAYLDKYLFFGFALRRKAVEWRRQGRIIHICDHSNAVYVPLLRGCAVVVTCHDLLAVRGALGEVPDCPASFLGRRLQNRILQGLGRAQALGFDSGATRRDFERLSPGGGGIRKAVIGLPPLDVFRPEVQAADMEVLRKHGVAAGGFILGVGSAQPRKNREGALRMFGAITAQVPEWKLVFAGDPLSPAQSALAEAIGVRSRVVAVENISDEELAAFYRHAHALLFPSRSEGFGWPVVEAQSCGCPVVCSRETSLEEVAGDGASVYDSADEAGMVQALLALRDPGVRRNLADKGFANLRRYTKEILVHGYKNLYEQAAESLQRH
jgi:glycosyltransferase involved in cell wall biosynthesis